MTDRCTVVFDVGKTNAKLSLWDRHGRCLERRVRRNGGLEAKRYRALDVHGLDHWLADTLHEYAERASIGALIPVGHGAAAALVSDEQLFAPPMDYEDDPEAEEREEYAIQRDPFTRTGSPALPHGLNLGMQLHRLERLTGPWPDDLSILPWPQYWSWRLSGIKAAECTSLGCHSDLWLPLDKRYSDLAIRRGWAGRMPPMRPAGETLGPITPEWAKRTGLPTDCLVLCGLHDSNSALFAARGHSAVSGHDLTVLSTGTWFVAMRCPAPGTATEPATLTETRDCLINVDVYGEPVPSARFMGGREAESLTGAMDAVTPNSVGPSAGSPPLIERLPTLLESGAMALPTFVRGCGPFPEAPGAWRKRPRDLRDRRAITGLYLALMADASLNLIGSQDQLLIEGRFAQDEIFVRALAALRPQQKVFISEARDDVAYGALRLLQSNLPPPSPLIEPAPLDLNFCAFAEQWREHATRKVS